MDRPKCFVTYTEIFDELFPEHVLNRVEVLLILKLLLDASVSKQCRHNTRDYLEEMGKKTSLIFFFKKYKAVEGLGTIL